MNWHTVNGMEFAYLDMNSGCFVDDSRELCDRGCKGDTVMFIPDSDGLHVLIAQGTRLFKISQAIKAARELGLQFNPANTEC